jgi:NAD(P)H-dependent FMN reductase|tara:strand:- start:346 stop:843 length:498 start_codon:yes stop_codon:yes gene_type:complete
MNNLLIISATNDNNLDLSNKLSSLLADIGHVSNVISLEDYLFPLFGSGDNADEVKITELIGMIKNAEGLIFCGPEYNGGVPPVLSNAITWVTVKSKDWRDAFNGKFAIIATSSGGDGNRFLTAFRSQLEHLGVNVLARTISSNPDKPLKEDSVKKILQGLVDVIR